MTSRALLKGKVHVRTLPICEPGAPAQPAVKRLLLEKGELAQFYTSADPVRTIAYCELVAGRPRGNHLHHKRFEQLYMVQGSCRLVVEDPASRARDEVLLEGGDLVTIEPGVAHALEPLVSGGAIEFSSMEFDVADTVPYQVL